MDGAQGGVGGGDMGWVLELKEEAQGWVLRGPEGGGVGAAWP